eukprot:NODE_10_length_61504_cov_0.956502.p41 type:complete len:184 gc:universal NODE_10_length_61504_cov_0.956502:38038-38589(+)
MILASGSPRRKELLSLLGKPFKVLVSNVDENLDERDPEKLVIELAKLKAVSVKNILQDDFECIIAADTIVCVDDLILGKPKNSEENLDMLNLMNNRSHFVITGVAILRKNDSNVETFFEKTLVEFGNNSQSLLEYVVQTGDGLDKAGGYGIQSIGSVLIRKITGCYSNVMGLPIHQLQIRLDK